jgi:hypothetical protein
LREQRFERKHLMTVQLPQPTLGHQCFPQQRVKARDTRDAAEEKEESQQLNVNYTKALSLRQRHALEKKDCRALEKKDCRALEKN